MSETKEERGARAFKLHQEVLANEEKRRSFLARNATILSQIYDEGLYKDLLGDEDGQWAGYLSDFRIFYSRNQIDSFLRVYNKMTKKLGVHPDIWVEVPITRLTDILPVIDQNNYEEWLIKAKILTTSDWNIEVRAAKGLITEEEHQVHDFKEYRICKQCGRKETINHNHEPNA